MRLIKLALISIVVFSLLLLAISSFLPGKVRISRAIDINAPVSKILPYLHDVHAWQKWNVYIRQDSGKQFDRDSNATAFVSPELSVKLTGVTDSLVSSSWSQKNGHDFVSAYYLASRKNVTVVQWYFDFKLKWYPWEKFSSIVYDQQLGPQMQESLASLKELAESSQ